MLKHKIKPIRDYSNLLDMFMFILDILVCKSYCMSEHMYPYFPQNVHEHEYEHNNELNSVTLHCFDVKCECCGHRFHKNNLSIW